MGSLPVQIPDAKRQRRDSCVRRAEGSQSSGNSQANPWKREAHTETRRSYPTVEALLWRALLPFGRKPIRPSEQPGCAGSDPNISHMCCLPYSLLVSVSTWKSLFYSPQTMGFAYIRNYWCRSRIIEKSFP